MSVASVKRSMSSSYISTSLSSLLLTAVHVKRLNQVQTFRVVNTRPALPRPTLKGVKRTVVLITKEVVFCHMFSLLDIVGLIDCIWRLVAHVDSSRFRFLRLRLPSLEGDSDCVPRSELLLPEDEGARAAACAASKRTWPIVVGEWSS
jgi:hypothetical protein